jgi:hypothetical protein
MTSDADLPQKTGIVQQPPPASQSWKPFVVIAVVLLSALVAGTAGYLLIRRSHQATLPHSQEMKEANKCVGAEVRSIKGLPELVIGVLHDPTPAKIEAIPVEASETTPSASGKAVTVIALGPVLGSMDSPEIKTDLACTAKGLVLTAIITRSANYNGGVRQNQNWRPRIEMALYLRQPEVLFKAIWKMRLTTGVELDHAQTPPSYPDQQYPITSRWREIWACNDNACGESKSHNFHESFLELTCLSAATDPKALTY